MVLQHMDGLAWGLVVAAAVCIGGVSAYAITGPHIDESSISYKEGFQDGLNVRGPENPFIGNPQSEWDSIKHDTYNSIADSLYSDCDDPAMTSSGPDDYSAYAWGVVEGEEQVALTSQAPGRPYWRWDCD
jgi:hypothetical protein